MSNSRKALVPMLIVALAVFSIRAAHSATWYVGNGDAAALEQTFNSAQGGDTVIVGPGTYDTAGGFSISKPLHIMSEKGPSVTIIANHGYCVGVGGPCYGSLGFYVQGFSGNFTITGFTFRDHSDTGDVPGLFGQGVMVVQVSGTISNNVFAHNEDGVGVSESPHVLIADNLFQNNRGDGVSAIGADSVEIRSNTFVSNFYNFWFGGSTALDVALQNNIIALASWGNMCVKGDSVTVTLSCNDVWSNGLHDCAGSSASSVDAGGNISLDPLFCDGYRLHQDSPCLGANTPALCNGDHMGCYPVPCEVAVEKQPWGKIKSIFK
jgi:nitrous oxidase accessory protein NosD